MSKRKKLRLPEKLSGVDGLVASVIRQAEKDARWGGPYDRRDALRYLRSETYKSHLQMIDKPEDWLPADD